MSKAASMKQENREYTQWDQLPEDKINCPEPYLT